MMNWIVEIQKKVLGKNYKFVSIHIQETGGKVPLKRHDMEKFINLFEPIVNSFDSSIFIIDDDVEHVTLYTALSSIYLIRNRESCKIFDFQENCFIDLKHGSEILWTSKSTKQCYFKRKFDKELFPNKILSRKGFMACNFTLNHKSLFVINVHFIHDANLMESFKNSPSCYSLSRKNQMNNLLKWLKDSSFKNAIIFGDFNFRVDLESYLKSLENFIEFSFITSECNSTLLIKSGDIEYGSITLKNLYLNEFFTHKIKNDYENLIKFDKELEFIDQTFISEASLFKYPSYCYTETEPSVINTYRCPSWCDRILFYGDLKRIPLENMIEYNLLGMECNLGDHKPVYTEISSDFL